MKSIGALVIGAVSMTLLVTIGGEASAQGENTYLNRRKAMRDRVGIVESMGGMAIGVVTMNPLIFGDASALLIRNTYRLGKNSARGRRNSTTTAPTSIAQPESLVAVPGRPGYLYYPSNPNQLYLDANAVAQINVQIANTAKDGRTIRYSVSGTDYEIPPGYSRLVVVPAGSTISYDRGDEVGTEMFTLTDGTYEFRTSERGWRFYATNPEVAKAKSVPRPTEASKPASAPRISERVSQAG